MNSLDKVKKLCCILSVRVIINNRLIYTINMVFMRGQLFVWFRWKYSKRKKAIQNQTTGMIKKYRMKNNQRDKNLNWRVLINKKQIPKYRIILMNQNLKDLTKVIQNLKNQKLRYLKIANQVTINLKTVIRIPQSLKYQRLTNLKEVTQALKHLK